MEQETKDKIKSIAYQYWYLLVLILFGVVIIFMNQRLNSKSKELSDLKMKANLTEQIEVIEARLDAMKAREAEYLKVQAQQDKLNEVLAELSDRQKELSNIKKGNIKNDITKMDSTTLSDMFNSMGYPNTVIQ
jgi:hypothetical protein